MNVRNNDEKLTRAEFEKVLKVILKILKKWNIRIHKSIFRAWWTIPWSAACWRCFKLPTPGSSHPSCANTITIKFSQKSISHITTLWLTFFIWVLNLEQGGSAVTKIIMFVAPGENHRRPIGNFLKMRSLLSRPLILSITLFFSWYLLSINVKL